MIQQEEKKKKPLWAKLISFFFLSGFFLAIILAVAGYFHYQNFVSSNFLEAEETAEFVIPKGSPWGKVVKILDKKGLLGVPQYFDFWARQRGLHQNSKAGSYKLTGPMTLEAFATKLAKGGDITEVSITIPEGFSIFKIADRLSEKGIMTRDSFLEAAKSSDLMLSLDVQGESFEGYLFPDTYRFKKGTSAEAIVRKMHAKWKVEWEKLVAENKTTHEALTKKYGFDRHDFLTMASLVERETGKAEERPLIAKVFYNRLTLGMKLQTDPTCVYSAENYLENPHPRTCKDPMNRYSTYIIKALPPGPIANTGRAAMLSAIKPSTKKGSDKMLYFVAKKDKERSHYFSKSLKEHERAVDKYLRNKK